jgi:primary-amine oxidase
MRRYRRYLMIVFVCALAVYAGIRFIRPALSQATSCSGVNRITFTFTNNAQWDMCWEQRNQEGIVFRTVYYRPPGGAQRLVLFQASLAEIFVPYDDGNPRFYDLSTYGLGGDHLVNLTSAECPGGTLINSGGKNMLCRQGLGRGYAHKYGSSQRQGRQVRLFSVSGIGNYYYISSWLFNDDGSIQPSVQATGQLYGDTSNATYGWPVGPGNTDYRTSHVHNYYWRLDFDLNGAANDQVEQFDFGGAGTTTRSRTTTAFTLETKQKINLEAMRFWRVRDTATLNADSHSISYEIEPLSSHAHRGPAAEPWTQNDFYLTQYRFCEQLAANNNGGSPCVANGNVSSFVNGESVSDVVIWFGATFHHVPRDEDQLYMPAHWSGFDIVPRDWTSQNPSISASVGSSESSAPNSADSAPNVVGNGDQAQASAGIAEVQGDVAYATDPSTNALTLDAPQQSEFTLQRAVTCDNQAQPVDVVLLAGEHVFAMAEVDPQSQVYAASVAVPAQFAAGASYPLQIRWICDVSEAPQYAFIGALNVSAALPDGQAGDEATGGAGENNSSQPLRIYLPVIAQE